MRLSIIMPVYKAEKYINKAIKSIVSQTYEDWELILVDDGSPDKSGMFCDDWAQKDSRIRVIHQENKGVSAARNLALNYIHGDYVFFMDSDDYIQKELLQSIKNKVDATDADVILLEAKRVFRNKEDKEPLIRLNSNAESMYLFKLVLCGFIKEQCLKVCRTEIIKQIKFHEDFKSGEDLYLVPDIMQKCNKVACISGKYYFYNKINESSLTHTVAQSESLGYDFYAWHHFYEFCIKNNWDRINENFSHLYLAQCMHYAVRIIRFQIAGNIRFDKVKQDAYRFIQKYDSEIIGEDNNRILNYKEHYYAFQAARLSWLISGGIDGIYKERIIRTLCKFSCIQSAMPALDQEGKIWKSIHEFAKLLTQRQTESSLWFGQKVVLYSIILNCNFVLRLKGKHILREK